MWKIEVKGRSVSRGLPLNQKLTEAAKGGGKPIDFCPSLERWRSSTLPQSNQEFIVH